MSRARDIADLAGSADAGGLTGRNLIINGAMQVAQRGTSATISSYGSVDRFRFDRANTDELAWTQTQQSVTDLAGFSNSYRITTTTAESAIAAAELAYVSQRIEAQNLQQLGYGTSSAKNLTLSFYVKSSVTGTFATNIYQVDDNRVINAEYSINAANTWERKEITYAADQTGVIDNNNDVGFYIVWNLALGSNYKGNAAATWEGYNTDNWAGSGTYTDAVITTLNATWEITGVQLEVGETATPFEHRSYGDELARCQRYYYREVNQSGAMFGYVGFADSSTNAYIQHPHVVEMRATPTLSTTGVATDYAIRRGANTLQCNNVPTLSSSTTLVAHVLWRTSSGLTSGQAVLGKHTGANDFLGWDAEL